jgi:hypothetical protein
VGHSRLIVGACILGVVLPIALGGCGENHRLTDEPIAMDIYVDATFSNDQVALGCLPDVMTAATLAAGSRGSVEFHTFDGDPFRRRGLSESFEATVLPANIKGTSGETTHLEEQAEELEPQIKELILEPPTVGGTPLLELLERAARHTASSGNLARILICTDGLFTDVNPLRMTAQQARIEGEALPQTLRGVTVDFIGLDGSAPGRGRRIEQTKPLVEALLLGAGAQLGEWDLELPPSWRTELIAAANSKAAS